MKVLLHSLRRRVALLALRPPSPVCLKERTSVFLRESLVNLLLFGHRVALLAGLSRQTSAPLTNSPPFASSSNRFLGWTLLILH